MTKQKVQLPGTPYTFRVNKNNISFFSSGKKVGDIGKSYIKPMTQFYLFWKEMKDAGVLKESEDFCVKWKGLASTSLGWGHKAELKGVAAFTRLATSVAELKLGHNCYARLKKINLETWFQDPAKIYAYLVTPEIEGDEGVHFILKRKSSGLPSEFYNFSVSDYKGLNITKDDLDKPSPYDKCSQDAIREVHAYRPSDSGIFLIDYILTNHIEFYDTPTIRADKKKVLKEAQTCEALHKSIELSQDKYAIVFNQTAACEPHVPTNTRELGRQQKRIFSYLAKCLSSSESSCPKGHIPANGWTAKDFQPFADRGFLTYEAVADNVNKTFLWKVDITPLGRCMLVG